MKKGPDGSLLPVSGYLRELLAGFAELKHPDIPAYDIFEWPNLIDSSDMTPAHWITLAKQIEEQYYHYDGFVILHGTDTMAYTASALSFMLENLAKTVVLTGSMIPLAAPVSDAKRNLIISMIVSVNHDVPEVCICFDNKLFRGNRSKKTDPISVNAFDSPNMAPLATMGTSISLRRHEILPAPRKRFTVHTRMFSRITVMIMTPGFDVSSIRAYVAGSSESHPLALVLHLFGTGNAPIRRKDFLEALEWGINERKAVVVILSQCLKGAVDMSQYETGNVLRQLGVIDGKDMTTEAAVAKLGYLMGRGLTGRALKVGMESNLRGELTDEKQLTYVRPGVSHEAYLSRL